MMNRQLSGSTVALVLTLVIAMGLLIEVTRSPFPRRCRPMEPWISRLD